MVDVPADELPPIANPDAAQVTAQQSVWIDVLANDTDPNPIDLSALGAELQSTTSSAGATIQVIGNQVLYTADVESFQSLGAGQSYTDTFSYRASDQWGAKSDWVTVTVRVGGNAVAGETLVGLNPPNVIAGHDGDDWICGGNNRDTLSGNGGADTIYGHNGKDLIFGGDGPDKLFGENGDDTLVGGAGSDTLSGGEGQNTFVFEVNFGNDRVVDFDPQHSKIEFSLFQFTGFADVKAHAAQVGEDVVITYDSENSVTLEHVSLRALRSSDFLFA